MSKLALFLTCFIVTTTLMKTSSAVPFLYNSGSTILSSLFKASSRTEAEDKSNIEDLRVPEDNNKEASRLQAEEYEFFKKTEKQEETQNEATPGFIQKKIGKILTKLQFFSALRNSLNFQGAEEEAQKNDDADFENKVDQVQSSSNVYKVMRPEDAQRIVLYPVMMDNSLVETARSIDLKASESKIHNSKDDSLKNNTNTKPEDLDEAFLDQEEGEEDSDTKYTPAAIGVYITELFGSIATLLYGAALQVANISSNASNSNR
ncbi:PREDICTED: uncharacterized protein LOC108561324 [Nicrophorus vespilloides]|uniref:Uncharacterized protein LOC108561324 n=1 Tax=Nicrophorus vespilloides TaxID=110193 RepID=A0ABM1MJD4_NICVS|nr:PREDICTED: uncharacterized protein LOC108561324 [Nicrophorus vespilloides]